MLEPNQLKKGVVFKHAGSPQQVLEYSHTHKGRGSATVTAKVRDLISGNVQVLTFKAGDRVEEADLGRAKATFLYVDNTTAFFMDSDTYEQYEISLNLISDFVGFLKESQEVGILSFEGAVISLDMPPKVDLKVDHTEPGVKGDTASGTVYKPAKLETGIEVQVPLFVKPCDIIRVNTETGEYVERVIE